MESIKVFVSIDDVKQFVRKRSTRVDILTSIVAEDRYCDDQFNQQVYHNSKDHPINHIDLLTYFVYVDQ